MKRFIALLFLSAVAACSAQPPNVVFLLADDMSRNTWGAYGSEDCQTPNIDQLAAEGLKFERAYCSVAMCAPFRQELYSGRSPWRTGTLANHSKSREETRSLPHYLQSLGYRIGLIGKTHIGPRSSYPFEYLESGANKREDNNAKFIAAAQAFIEAAREEKKPFCLFIASNDSHAPFTTGDRSPYDADALTIPPYWLDTPELRETLVEYYAEITNFDALVGETRALLERQGLWENTLFFVCSEQGAQLPFAKWTCYDNGLRTGLIAHWAGVIPAGATSAALISTADIAPTLVEAAGGRLQDGDWDGKSFLKTLKGEQEVLNDYLYGAFTNVNIVDNRERVFPIRSIRDEAFALIYNPNYEGLTSNLTLTGALEMLDGTPTKKKDIGTSWAELSQKEPAAQALVRKLHHRPEYELYNLNKDPFELQNEIHNPEYKEVVARMKRQLMKKLEELGDADPIETEKKLIAKKGD